jgi:catechol 2,3-dioxygenase-like lactoylglutathione lyase family enzyme
VAGGAILDHVTFPVGDFDAARAFYAAALSPLGLSEVLTMTAEETGGVRVAGFGRADEPHLPAFEFWSGERASPIHIALRAATRAEVDAFHAAALAAGASDNGGPGLRNHYHAHYYAAFVIDPDGHNLEAVCHAPA